MHRPWAALGYNRDGKQGLLQVDYGLWTDAGGCSISVSVYPGNSEDTDGLLERIGV